MDEHSAWRDRSLVTVIELLCPYQKSGWGRIDYVAKRRRALAQAVNLVEIDLLKAGKRLPIAHSLPDSDYLVYVTRSNAGSAEISGWDVRHPVPPLLIPLHPPDSDIVIDFAALLNHTYERGRYARELRYHKPLLVPLRPADVRWAEQTAAMVRQPRV